MVYAALLAVAFWASTAAQPPAGPDAEITLERTACFGTCPVYSVRITGDGAVEYIGKQYVRVVGPARKRISVAAVQQLLEFIERAGYFQMEPEYRYLIGPNGSRGSVTDLPTTTTSVRIGDRRHRIVDYAWAPDALREIERAIDRAAGTARWISVDRQVVDELVRGGWKAASPEGTRYLAAAVERSDLDTVDALLSAGVEPNAQPPGILPYATDPAILARLIDGGADVNGASPSGETVLMIAVRRGDAEKVRVLIDAGALVTSSNSEGQTALQMAREALVRSQAAPPSRSPTGPTITPDYGTIVRLLVAAGAKE
jgi:hypothetical protein